MKTTYEIRTPDLGGIFISFGDEHSAMKWWRDNVEPTPSTSIYHRAVVVKHVRETHSEAETARLDFMLTEKGVQAFSRACAELGCTGTDWPGDARKALDLARNAPPSVATVIWPNTKREERGV